MSFLQPGMLQNFLDDPQLAGGLMTKPGKMAAAGPVGKLNTTPGPVPWNPMLQSLLTESLHAPRQQPEVMT